ncbi:MAG TPA: C25 family cysteine peptidase, partial [Puia sp.]|nr:C25 family cysteine peptidase [Puia sp.]
MKKIFTILLLLVTWGLSAQPYNNEWIDFSKTYYKFKVGANGLYRIPQSVLAGAGLGSTPAQYFQLFRNGQEVPIYTSVDTGALGPTDYIEFWGLMNDGKADKPLYRNPAYQHTDKWSLQTDTAVYFLTVNPTSPTFHFAKATNDTTGNILPVEPYFMHKAATYFKTQLNPGYAVVLEQYIYSSSYDIGEFWSSAFISQGVPLLDNQSNLFIYNTGPGATFKFGAVGCADTLRHIQASVNGFLLKDTIMNSFNDLVTNVNLPLTDLNSASNNIQFTDITPATQMTDRAVVSYYEITYPRQFNFGGLSNFYFELAPKASGYYLNINNFNAGSGVPVLYDLSSGQRYVAIIGGGTLYFVLPGSASTRKFVLVSEDPSNITAVGTLTQKNFISFSNPANQGNYIIISNPSLYTGTNNNNPVVDYKNYRSSAAGGSFNTQLIDINELVDQFSFGIKKHPSSIKNFLNYARSVYASKPQFVFLIGRGMTYNDYRTNESNPSTDILNPVPTFGYPASDNMLSTQDGAQTVPLTPIGRLAAISGPEVEIYLSKIKEFEQAQQINPNTIAGRGWMKNVIHITGATDPYLEAILCNYMNYYRGIIIDTLFGANVTTFCSTSVDQNDQVSAAAFPQLFSNGIGMMTYFGHSSASSLGFNLDDPTIYNNQGKYPVFYVNGCYAGNFYTFDPGRLSLSKTLSESYVLAKEKGSIAFIASTHYGIVNYLNLLLNGLYNLIDNSDYGKGIGVIQADAAQSLMTILPTDFLARSEAEEMNIDGDPAAK